MSEDIEGIEKEIEIELSKIGVSSFEDDSDTEVSDEALSDSETISDDLPGSVISYVNFIKSRNQDAEKIILQDLEDEETTSNICGVVSCPASDYLAELASEYNEDPEQFKKRVLSEIENEDLLIAAPPSYSSQSTSDDVVTDDRFLTADVEMSISLTHREVEEKCRQEFEQWEKRQKDLEDEKRKKWKAEREAQEKQNEEEHARRVQDLEELESEIIKLELLQKGRCINFTRVKSDGTSAPYSPPPKLPRPDTNVLNNAPRNPSPPVSLQPPSRQPPPGPPPSRAPPGPPPSRPPPQPMA